MMLLKKLKTLEILEKPETIFNRRLSLNPFYPFEELERNEFVLELSKRRYYIGSFMTFACLVVLIAWLFATSPGQHMMFPVLVGAVSGLMAWEHRGRRTCVLNCDMKQYVCAKDGEPVFTGKFHNVYIRLKAQKHGAGQMYYYVVFNGYRMREQKITSYSKNDRKLRVLAKRLAETLDLNFFDVKASSKEHVIRHRPGQEDVAVPDDGKMDRGRPV